MMPRRRRRLASRIRHYVRGLLAFLFSNVGVVVLVVAYTIAGAFMFQAIEGGSEMRLDKQMTCARDNLTQYLWQNVTLDLNLFNETAVKERWVYAFIVFMFQAIEGGSEMRLDKQMTCARDNLTQYLWQNVTLDLNLFNETAVKERWVYAFIVFMFQAIEGGSEMRLDKQMTCARDNLTQYLWQNVTLDLNLFNETAVKERIGTELRNYQTTIVRAVHRGWDGGRSSRQWSFSSSFLYSLTVITTIGYGHLSPKTDWGKVVTILYALLGMPLFLLYLTNVGELLARWFKCIYALVCLCRGCPGFTRRRAARLRLQYELSEAESIERPAAWRRDCDVTHSLYADRYDDPRGYARRPDYLRSISMPSPHMHNTPYPRVSTRRGVSEPVHHSPSPDPSDFSYVTFDAQTITVPISVCVAIMVGYIMFGSMIFGMWEKWDQLDGAYFCFISLSSIGFGDFVPGERVYTPRIEPSFIVCSLYLMLGMALVAMCFNLMQEQVMHYFAAVKRVVKRLGRCKR